MNRRDLLQLGIGQGLLTASASTVGADAAATAGSLDVVVASMAEPQAAMAQGKLTSLALVNAYLSRIQAIDRSGAKINAVIELNPQAKAVAAKLDKERQTKGPRGPLHGIPVLIKDNIATADRMQTTAGSLALLGQRAVKDAFLVQKLREAGAVILGKTNL